jgi:hypothetical protein
MHTHIQHTGASFVSGTPYQPAFGVISSEADERTSCAQAASHRERGL